MVKLIENTVLYYPPLIAVLLYTGKWIRLDECFILQCFAESSRLRCLLMDFECFSNGSCGCTLISMSECFVKKHRMEIHFKYHDYEHLFIHFEAGGQLTLYWQSLQRRLRCRWTAVMIKGEISAKGGAICISRGPYEISCYHRMYKSYEIRSPNKVLNNFQRPFL